MQGDSICGWATMAGSGISSKVGIVCVKIHKVGLPHLFWDYLLLLVYFFQTFWYIYFIYLLSISLTVQFLFNSSAMSYSFSVYAFFQIPPLPPQLSVNTCICFIRLMIVPFTRVRNRSTAELPFLNHASFLDASHPLDSCHLSLLW